MAPAAVLAQDISGAATLGYNFADISDGFDSIDVDALTIDGRVNVDVGNGLSFGARASAASLDIEGAPDKLGASVIGANVGYRFGNGFSVGTYAEQGTLSSDMLPFDITLKSFGVTGGYDFGKGSIGAFYGTSDMSPSLLSPDLDITDFGLTAKYAPMANLTLAGAFTRTNLDVGFDDADIDYLGVAAVYDISSQWTVFGGYANTSLDMGGSDLDLNTFGLGVSYDTTSVLTVNSFASLELARTSTSDLGADLDLDTVRIGMTIPFGSTGSKVPMNSVADSIMNPSHSAITQTGLSGL